MRRTRTTLLSAFASAAFLVITACTVADSTGLDSSYGFGSLVVRLTDAPFLADSVQSVDIFVVSVEGRTSETNDADANSNVDNGSSSGWQVLASPNASFNLLALQNGISALLGGAKLPVGTYYGFRLIIDPSKSSVTLKNGMVLTSTSKPNVTFPSASKSGIKIALAEPVKVLAGSTSTLLIDFDVNSSFVQRGNSIQKNGLLFNPVITARITESESDVVNFDLRREHFSLRAP